MEYRKLIKFGNSSSVISLPKSWLEKNKINKGDSVYIEEKGDELVILPSKKDFVNKEKEITIDITNKDNDSIKREVVSAYINNNNTIRIIGNDIQSRSEDVRRILHELVALEIMEQSSDKIIAKDFLNIKEASIENIIRKIDIIIRSMFSDCKNFKNNESIINMDQDVNRLYFLILRAIKYANENPLVLKTYKMSYQDVINSYQLAMSMEKIADEIKRISRFIEKAKFDEGTKKEIVEVITEIEKTYINTMKAFYAKDKNIALDAAKTRKSLMMKCDNLFIANKGKEHIVNIAERCKNTVHYIHDIIRQVYTN